MASPDESPTQAIPASAFFTYPFRSPVVWLIPLCFLCFFIPLVNFLVPFVLIGYLASIVSYTAAGHTDPPEADFGELLSGALVGLKWFGVTIVWLVPIAILSVLLPPFFLLQFVVFGLAPAAFMRLAVTGRFGLAVNPAEAWEQIKEVGGGYVVLLLVLLGLTGVFWLIMAAFMGSMVPEIQELAESRRQGGQPPDPEAMLDGGVHGRILLTALVVNIGSFYLGAGLCHYMGSLVLNSGTGPTPAGGAGEPDRADPLAPVTSAGSQQAQSVPDEDLSRVDGFIQEGKEMAALAELRGIARRHRDSADLQNKQYRLARSVGDSHALAEATDRLIDEHLARGRTRQAAEILGETLQHNPDYRPQRPEAHLPLVKALRTAGEARAAVRLANGFHKRFPESAEIPSLYATVARIFREDLGKEEQYDALCRFLSQQYPDDPETIAVTAFWRPDQTGH